VPDRVIVLKKTGAPAQAIDEANFRIEQSIPPRYIHQLPHWQKAAPSNFIAQVRGEISGRSFKLPSATSLE
jgi:hypothetical protein